MMTPRLLAMLVPVFFAVSLVSPPLTDSVRNYLIDTRAFHHHHHHHQLLTASVFRVLMQLMAFQHPSFEKSTIHIIAE
jgi:hypothetical protein